MYEEDEDEYNMNMNNEYEMRGGTIINTNYKMKDTSNPLSDSQWTEGLFEMIDNANSVECISYESLKGFIFVIEMNKSDNYPFKSVALGDKGEQQIKGLSKILLKITLLSDKEQTLPPFKDKYKMTDTETIFIDEVKVQQELFSDILTATMDDKNNKGTAYCPSILYHSILENNDKKEKDAFLDLLKIKSNNKIHNEIDYLKINEQKIGLVAMEYLDGYNTYYQFLKKNPGNPGKSGKESINLIRFRVNIIATILIILLEKNIIHTDLHMNNVMVFNGCCGVNFIDFGRVLNLNQEISEELTEKIKELIQKIYQIPYFEYETSQSNKVLPAAIKTHYDDNIKKTITDIIQLIYDIELKYLQNTINKSIKNAQSIWVYKDIFDIYAQSFIEKEDTIDKLKAKYYHHIIDILRRFYLNKNIDQKNNEEINKLYKTENNTTNIYSILLNSYVKIMNENPNNLSIIKDSKNIYHFYYHNQMFHPILEHIQTLASLNDASITQQSNFASLYIPDLKIEGDYKISMNNTVIKTLVDICMVHSILLNDLIQLNDNIKTILTPYIEKITQLEIEPASSQSEFFKQMIELFKSNDKKNELMENLNKQLNDPFYKNLIDINGNTPFHFLILLFYLSKVNYNSEIEDEDLNKFKNAVTIPDNTNQDDALLYPVFDELIHIKNKYGLTSKCLIDFYIEPDATETAQTNTSPDELTKCDIKPDINPGKIIKIEINDGKQTITDLPDSDSWDNLLTQSDNKIIKVLNTVVTLDNDIISDYIKTLIDEKKTQPFKIYFLYTQDTTSQIITINYIVIEPII